MHSSKGLKAKAKGRGVFTVAYNTKRNLSFDVHAKHFAKLRLSESRETSQSRFSFDKGIKIKRSGRNLATVCMSSASEGGGGGKVGVIFVCLGNICRSPAAEAMFKQVVKDSGLESRFDIDSCGTGGGNPSWYLPGGMSYHEGESSDPRMKQAASKRGINITSYSRPLNTQDFDRFQYVVGMDQSNLKAIDTAAEAWDIKTDEVSSYKVVNMADYCTEHDVTRVPDPYYENNFNLVLDLLEDACKGLLSEIVQEQGLQ